MDWLGIVGIWKFEIIGYLFNLSIIINIFATLCRGLRSEEFGGRDRDLSFILWGIMGLFFGLLLGGWVEGGYLG